MTNGDNGKEFDLEKRTSEYAKSIIRLCLKLPKNLINIQIIGQLIRSSGSVGANYREANDSLGKKDFQHKIKISRKESKESYYWLDLLIEPNPTFKSEIEANMREVRELINIFSAILNKCQS